MKIVIYQKTGKNAGQYEVVEVNNLENTYDEKGTIQIAVVTEGEITNINK